MTNPLNGLVPHNLHLPLPLMKGATGLRCRITHTEKRVKMTLIVVRPDRAHEEYKARFGVTFWRGILLPALQHFAAHHAIPFDLKMDAEPTQRAVRPRGD